MTTPVKDDKYARIVKTFDSFLTDPVTPVLGYALTVIEDGKITFKHAGGYREFDANDPTQCLPMNSETRFRIASISKMFTCVGIMQQVDQGKMSLDGDASEYLGFTLRNPHYPDVVITPRLLMAHYGSVRDGSAYSIPVDVPVSECFLPGGRYYGDAEHFGGPGEGPGEAYYYSNLNYGLLGTMIERLSGERFDHYMRKHVLGPLGVGASFNPGLLPAGDVANLATLYDTVGPDGQWSATNPWRPQMDDYHGVDRDPDEVVISNPDLGTANVVESAANYKIGTNGTIYSPQGGLRISPLELAELPVMMLNKGVASNGNRIISEAAVADLIVPVWQHHDDRINKDPYDATRAYGAGISIVSTAIGRDRIVEGRDDITLYGHTGGGYGLSSACYWDPVTRNGFTYALNGVGAQAELHRGKIAHRSIWQETLIGAMAKELM